MARGYEYNDEINRPTDHGDPTHVFTNREEACKEVKKQTQDYLRRILKNCEWAAWGYSFKEMFGSTLHLSQDEGLVWESLYKRMYREELTMPEVYTEEEFNVMVKSIDPVPFYIVELR
jgi:hypothetical protein